MEQSVLRYTITALLLNIICSTIGEVEPVVQKSFSVVKVKSMAGSVDGRVKRALPASAYTQEEKDSIVAKHNEYRKAEPASDMQYMVRCLYKRDLHYLCLDHLNLPHFHGQPVIASQKG